MLWDVSAYLNEMKGEGKGVSGGVLKFWMCGNGYCGVRRGRCESEV